MTEHRYYIAPSTGGVTKAEFIEGDYDAEIGTLFRPVVVIDPEDRRAIWRLADIFCAQPSIGWVDLMQDALREFVKPSKPEEPTGLGAVVEDADGVKWVRVASTSHPWVRSMRARSKWDAIDAVRVLSEGVPES